MRNKDSCKSYRVARFTTTDTVFFWNATTLGQISVSLRECNLCNATRLVILISARVWSSNDRRSKAAIQDSALLIVSLSQQSTLGDRESRVIASHPIGNRTAFVYIVPETELSQRKRATFQNDGRWRQCMCVCVCEIIVIIAHFWDCFPSFVICYLDITSQNSTRNPPLIFQVILKLTCFI